MNQRFQNKIVLVSGTISRIGEKVALTFAEQGANIILSSSNTDWKEDLVRKIKKVAVKPIENRMAMNSLAANCLFRLISPLLAEGFFIK